MTIRPGALRFNTDSMKLEIFRGSANYEGTASMAGIGTLAAGQWEEIQATSPDVQTGGTRGLIAGGRVSLPNFSDVIEYITVDTTGNATDFGDLTHSLTVGSAFGSPTRGVWAAGYAGGNTNIINYIAFATKGNAVDYGDLNRSTHRCTGASNSHGGLG